MSAVSREVALVTGATSGIGMAAALKLGQRGAAVGVIGRNRDAGESVANRIRDFGGEALFLPVDVSNRMLRTFARLAGGLIAPRGGFAWSSSQPC